MNNELTPKQQTSEAIRQAETIIITAGQHPTVDQVAATVALATILRKFGKKVSAIISDQLPQQAQFLDTTGLDKNLSGLRDFVLKVDVSKAEVDKLRYEVEDGKLNVFITPFKGGFAPSDVTFGYGDFHYDLALVLGVANRSRIDRVYAENQGLFNSIPLINIDFHRSNENYGAINLIEPMASSLCEILIALSESLQTGLIDADIATTMLTGLMASTDRFTATHTTSKSLTVAAQMMAAGARQGQVVKGLYGGGGRENRPERSGDQNRVDQNRNDQNRGDRNERSERGERTERADRNEQRNERPREERRNEVNGRSEQTPRSEQPARAEQPVRAEMRNDQPRAQQAPTTVATPAQAPIRELNEAAQRGSEQARVTEVIQPQPVPAVERPVPATTRVETDERPAAAPSPVETPVRESEPLIQPNHIEMSPLDQSPAEVVEEAPTQPLPMADFAAAAEVLRHMDDQNPADR